MINIAELILTGLFVGVGSALGTYLSNQLLIKRMEKLLNRRRKV